MKPILFPKGNRDPIDIYVGKRLRLRRSLIGVSQAQLGKAVGISFQQIQKYERGINRMGASRLYQFAGLLRVSVSYFFDDIETEQKTEEALQNKVVPLKAAPKQMHNKETLQLVRAFHAISDKKQRNKVMSLIKTMAIE